MTHLPEHLPTEIRQRKVLTEKYRSNRLWMVEWLNKQQNKTAKNQQYEETVKWREFERAFYNIEENEEKHYLRTEFDDIFFYLYERIE